MQIKLGTIELWNSQEQSRTNDKKMISVEIGVTLLLVSSYLINASFLTLISFVLVCALVIASRYRNSILYLAYFTSFASLFFYQGKHMYFVLVALFIIKALFTNNIKKSTLLYYLLITIYCMIFSDFNAEYSFAKIIGLVLLFAVPLIADYSDKIDCNEFMQHYIFGFTVATILGFFVMSIPSMKALFSYDLMWTASYQELTRFFGLAFDCNFYAFSNYIIVAYLVFAFDKITRSRGILILFFILAGLQTVSKSYFLVLGLLLVCYIITNIKHFKKIVLAFAVGAIGFAAFIFISDKLGYNVIELILDRFVIGGGFAENTTGRVDIWNRYFDMFRQAGIKECFFGFGFNATVKSAAHNTFIEFFYHFGLVGLLLWLMYFAYCARRFIHNTQNFYAKSPMVMLCFILGVFFLSAYTYEAFWISMVISFMTFGIRNREGVLGADV